MIIMMENGIKIVNNKKSGIKHIVVAGGGGYIGRYFVKFLLKTDPNIKIIIVTRNLGRKMFFQDSRVELVTGFDKIKVHDADIFNFAYSNAISFKKGAKMSRALIDSLTNSLVDSYSGTIIHISSVAVYNAQSSLSAHLTPEKLQGIRKNDPYSYLKAMAEQRLSSNCKNKNIKYKIVRLGNVMGPGSAWVNLLYSRYLSGEPLTESTIKHYSNTTFIGNTVHFIYKLSKSSNKKVYYNLCEFGGKEWGDWLNALNVIDKDKIKCWPIKTSKEINPQIRDDIRFVKNIIVGTVAPIALKLTGIYSHLLKVLDLFNINLEKTRDKTKVKIRISNSKKEYYLLKEYQIAEIYLNTKEIGLEGYNVKEIVDIPFSFEESARIINNYLIYNEVV